MSEASQETALAQILAALEALPTRVSRRAPGGLPSDLGRDRIIPTKETLELVCSSPANWRRMRKLKLAPEPVQIGLRKQGYRVGDLLDYLESRSQRAAPMSRAA